MHASNSTPIDITVVYERYADMLYRVAYSVLFSKEAAEDAVSEVFFKYIDKRPSFNGNEHEKAWFIRVTINQCHDIQRKRTIRSYTPLDEIAEVADETDDGDSVLEEVLALPEKYKTVIILFYYEDMAISQIAEGLKLTQAAVKMRLKRGREMLKSVLKGDDANV